MMSSYSRAVAGVVALALVALPGSVAACAMLCAPSDSLADVTSGSMSHTHHAAEAARLAPSNDARVLTGTEPEHLCANHAGNIQGARARVARTRTDASVLQHFETSELRLAATAALIAPHRGSGHGPEPGPSRSVLSVVLRI